jgi:hypothetical protein
MSIIGNPMRGSTFTSNGTGENGVDAVMLVDDTPDR